MPNIEIWGEIQVSNKRGKSVNIWSIGGIRSKCKFYWPDTERIPISKHVNEKSCNREEGAETIQAEYEQKWGKAENSKNRVLQAVDALFSIIIFENKWSSEAESSSNILMKFAKSTWEAKGKKASSICWLKRNIQSGQKKKTINTLSFSSETKNSLKQERREGAWTFSRPWVLLWAWKITISAEVIIKRWRKGLVLWMRL